MAPTPPQKSRGHLEIQRVTYHTWPWVGHLALVGTPLVMGALSVGKGPVEDLPDVGHAVHTDSRTPENMAAVGQRVGSAEHAWHRWQWEHQQPQADQGSSQQLLVTGTGQVMGSCSWMSPEAGVAPPT